MTVLGRPLPERPRYSVASLPPVKRSRPAPAANATLVGRDDITATLAVFVIELDQPLAGWRPGQYVSLCVEVAGELIQRPYSIVSCGAAGTRLELFVRRLPNGRLSNLLWSLSPGDRLVVGPPRGLFTLDSDDRRPRVMVGTGTGVAPLVAMLDAATHGGDHTRSVLIQGASFAGELAFGERIRSWVDAGLPLDYRPTVSRPHELRNAGWVGRTGRADSQLSGLLDEWRWLRAGGSVAYVCGNPEMVAACSSLLREAGFCATDIHVELFHAPVTPATL